MFMLFDFVIFGDLILLNCIVMVLFICFCVGVMCVLNVLMVCYYVECVLVGLIIIEVMLVML